MINVLVVKEHSAAVESTVRDLRRQGYKTCEVGKGREALDMYQGADLILLDLELPDIDGLEVCRAIRARASTPIISFTDRNTELDRVLALQAGSDDCIAKSCGLREVLARIEAVLRRAYPRLPGRRAISLPQLNIDGAAREVRLRGRPVEVTAKEFDLLYTLAANPSRVLSRKELMRTIWESDRVESSRTLDTHVSSLRAKLGSTRWIVTVRGVGYRIGSA